MFDFCASKTEIVEQEKKLGELNWKSMLKTINNWMKKYKAMRSGK